MKKLLFIITALLTCAVTMTAGDKGEGTERKDLRFAYDVDFEMNFDNREFYRSAFSSSMTIFGARLTPAIGLEGQYSMMERHTASWQA